MGIQACYSCSFRKSAFAPLRKSVTRCHLGFQVVTLYMAPSKCPFSKYGKVKAQVTMAAIYHDGEENIRGWPFITCEGRRPFY